MRKARLLEEKLGVRTMYHGSDTRIQKFSLDYTDKDFYTSNSDAYGPGIYVSESKDVAIMYGKYLYTLQVGKGTFWGNTKAHRGEWESVGKKIIKKADDWEMEAQNWDMNPVIGLNKCVAANAKYSNSDADFILSMWLEFFKHTNKLFCESANKLGVNGMYFKDQKITTIFDPSLITIIGVENA